MTLSTQRRAALIAAGTAALVAAGLPLANPVSASPPGPVCETGPVADTSLVCVLPAGATIEITMRGANGGSGGAGGAGGAGGSSNTVPQFTGGLGGWGGRSEVGGAGAKVRVVYTNTTSDYLSVAIEKGVEGAAGADGAAGIAGADAPPGGPPQAGGDGTPGGNGLDGASGSGSGVIFGLDTANPFGVLAGGGAGGGGGSGGQGGQGGQLDGFGMDGLNGANGLPGADGTIQAPGVPSSLTWTELDTTYSEAPFASIKVTLKTTSITITGGRDGRAMEVTGTSVGLAGKKAKVLLRMRGWDTYRQVGTVTIGANGKFTWTTTGRPRMGYVIVQSGETKSNRATVPSIK